MAGSLGGLTGSMFGILYFGVWDSLYVGRKDPFFFLRYKLSLGGFVKGCLGLLRVV